MWYASCSIGAHLTPSIVVPCRVLEAGASTDPCSSGTFSGPGWPGDCVCACVPVAGVEALLLLLELELEPQPAIRSAPHASSSSAARRGRGSAPPTAAEDLQEEQEDVEDVEEDRRGD